jgi:hypothetical protein
LPLALIPTVFEKELPPSQNELEKIINEMLDDGKTSAEVNAAIKAYQKAQHRT